MKNFMEFFFDFITGGVFNYIGAALRKPFSKKKFMALAEETQSNNIGMLATAVLMLFVFIYIRKFI